MDYNIDIVLFYWFDMILIDLKMNFWKFLNLNGKIIQHYFPTRTSKLKFSKHFKKQNHRKIWILKIVWILICGIDETIKRNMLSRNMLESFKIHAELTETHYELQKWQLSI